MHSYEFRCDERPRVAQQRCQLSLCYRGVQGQDSLPCHSAMCEGECRLYSLVQAICAAEPTCRSSGTALLRPKDGHAKIAIGFEDSDQTGTSERVHRLSTNDVCLATVIAKSSARSAVVVFSPFVSQGKSQ